MPDHTPVRARDLVTAIDGALGDLTALRATMTEALIRAHRDADSGFGAGGTNEAVAQSSITDRATAERALSHWRGGEHDDLIYEPDRVVQNARKMIDAIGTARAMSTIALRCAGALLPLPRERAQTLLAEVEGAPAYCANCGVQVWRTKTDRLVAGRCTACYEYRRTHEGKERPRDLWPDTIAKSVPERLDTG